jgi:[ribosomal protein S5]-alanine N-acetyltransferase
MVMINHKGTIRLETDRLILRMFTISDVCDMYNNWAKDNEVAIYMRWDAHKNIDETHGYLEKLIESYNDIKTYRWVIVLKSENKAVGSIGFHLSDDYDMCGDVSYSLGRAYWNKGIISEALKEVLRFGLVDVGLNRIESFHAISNPASGEVMKKCGMKYEGKARQKYRSHNGFEDCNMYAILREDLIPIINED